METKQGLLSMQVGDLVIVKAPHKSAGDNGVIVETSGDFVKVYWRESDKTYWIEGFRLRVEHESR